jgi:hypothetical protein
VWDKIGDLVQRFSKRQRRISLNTDRVIENNARVIMKDFEKLPEDKQKRMLEGNKVFRDVMNRRKGEEGRNANL